MKIKKSKEITVEEDIPFHVRLVLNHIFEGVCTPFYKYFNSCGEVKGEQDLENEEI